MTNRGPSKPRRPNPHPKTFTADKGPPGWRWHLPYIILVSSAQCEATCQETWKGRCKYYQAVFLVYTYLKIKMYIYIYVYVYVSMYVYVKAQENLPLQQLRNPCNKNCSVSAEWVKMLNRSSSAIHVCN